MNPTNSEPQLSPQANALIKMAAAGRFAPETVEHPELGALVRYAAGVLSTEEATSIEFLSTRDMRFGSLLAKTFRLVEQLRGLTWVELKSFRYDDPIEDEIRQEWTEIAVESILPSSTESSTLTSLSVLARASREGMRVAKGIIADLLDSTLAPRRPEMVAATRSGRDMPLLEGFALALDDDLRFSAEVDTEGSLGLTMNLPRHHSASGRTLWIAFEVNRQWIGLGSTLVQEESASLAVPGFGQLLGLSAGRIPPELFAIRFDEWPSVCDVGAFVVQSASQPFAEVESEPYADGANLSVDIRLLPHSPEFERSTQVELWFGTGGHVWQLLGRWPLPTNLDETMTLQCPAPKPGPIGTTFPGVLKLALRP